MSAKTDHPGVIAPPPLLYAGAFLLGLVLDGLIGRGLPVSSGARSAAAFLLGVPGLLMALAALARFVAKGTNVLPHKPTKTIVTDGVYRYSRNPMYLALALIYLALALTLNSLGALLLFVPLMAAVQTGVVAREERYLARKFGNVYLAYKRRVRRWL